MKNIDEAVLKYMQERGWDNPTPADMVKSISIESAELLELFQWSHESLEDLKNNPEKMQKVKDELGDIFIYSVAVAVLLGWTTEEVTLEKLKISAEKYPADLMRSKDALEQYHKIKQDHRIKK